MRIHANVTEAVMKLVLKCKCISVHIAVQILCQLFSQTSAICKWCQLPTEHWLHILMGIIKMNINTTEKMKTVMKLFTIKVRQIQSSKSRLWHQRTSTPNKHVLVTNLPTNCLQNSSHHLLLPPFYGQKWPLYRTTCISRHSQLRTGGFCWSKVLLPACRCWWQLAHSDYGEDARVLLNGVTCTVSVPSTNISGKDFSLCPHQLTDPHIAVMTYNIFVYIHLACLNPTVITCQQTSADKLSSSLPQTVPALSPKYRIH